MVFELLIEYGEHGSSSFAQLPNMIRSVFVSGQPSSIWVARARNLFRARFSASELDISVSSSTSFASSSHQRIRIPTIELGSHLSRSVQIELGFYFSRSGANRARYQIEDVIELGELGLPIFRGGEGGNTIQVHFASEKQEKSLLSFTPSRTSKITVESQLFLPIFAHILSYHLK